MAACGASQFSARRPSRAIPIYYDARPTHAASDKRFSRKKYGSWRSTSVGICASKAALCATGHVRTFRDTNAVLDRSVQSMHVQFLRSVQRSSLNKFHVCVQTFQFEQKGLRLDAFEEPLKLCRSHTCPDGEGIKTRTFVAV